MAALRALGLWVTLCALFACRARPTQVTLLLDSNVDPARPMELSFVTLEGTRSLAELRALPSSSATRLPRGARPMFPGSLSLVPKSGAPRSGPVTMLAVLQAPEFGRQPAFRIERLQRLAWIEGTPLQARMVFNVACSTPTTGCTQEPAERCTISQRCLEQGQTCGDNGARPPIDLPTVVVPPQIPLDGTVPCGPDRHALGGGCVANGGVRPIAPLSLGTTTSLGPALRFELPAGADGAFIELCRDRACTEPFNTIRVYG
jgi:hypothetical protein